MRQTYQSTCSNIEKIRILNHPIVHVPPLPLCYQHHQIRSSATQAVEVEGGAGDSWFTEPQIRLCHWSSWIIWPSHCPLIGGRVYTNVGWMFPRQFMIPLHPSCAVTIKMSRRLLTPISMWGWNHLFAVVRLKSHHLCCCSPCLQGTPWLIVQISSHPTKLCLDSTSSTTNIKEYCNSNWIQLTKEIVEWNHKIFLMSQPAALFVLRSVKDLTV